MTDGGGAEGDAHEMEWTNQGRAQKDRNAIWTSDAARDGGTSAVVAPEIGVSRHYLRIQFQHFDRLHYLPGHPPFLLLDWRCEKGTAPACPKRKQKSISGGFGPAAVNHSDRQPP